MKWAFLILAPGMSARIMRRETEKDKRLSDLVVGIGDGFMNVLWDENIEGYPEKFKDESEIETVDIFAKKKPATNTKTSTTPNQQISTDSQKESSTTTRSTTSTIETVTVTSKSSVVVDTTISSQITNVTTSPEIQTSAGTEAK